MNTGYLFALGVDVVASVDFWLGRLSAKNARVCRDIFKAWLEWLRVNGGGAFTQYSPDDLVAYQKQATGDDRYKILELVQAYVNVTGSRVSYKRRLYSGLKSFFAHNRAELPTDKGYVIRAPLEKVRGDLTVDEFKAILASCNKMYRAAFLSMFMGGMGLGELIDWSNNGYDSLMDQLDRDSKPIRIDLAGRKKARNERPYHTYLGRDAIVALREYLATRPRGKGTALFQSQRGVPLKEATARWYWNKKIERLGFTGGKKGKGTGIRYGKNPHELRDLFRTRWEQSGTNGTAAEYFMGHQIDPLDYNKAYRNENFTRSLYLEAEPWLNVLSEEPDKISRFDIARMEAKTNETLEALRLRIEELEAINEVLRYHKTPPEEVQKDLTDRVRRIQARKRTR